MEGPSRMRDHAGAGLRRVLASSSLDEPPEGAMERTLAKVGGVAMTAAAVTAVAKTAAAHSAGGTAIAGTTALGLAKWTAVGVIAGVVGMGTLEVTGALSPPAKPAPAAIAAPPPVTVLPTIAQQRAPVESVSAQPVPPPIEPRRELVPSPTPSASAAASTRSSLQAEMKELDLVRQAIAQRRAGEALQRLDVFAAEHPRAKLSEEASVLRIEALMASGTASEAKARATEFLLAHPHSAFGDRIRSLTGLATETGKTVAE